MNEQVRRLAEEWLIPFGPEAHHQLDEQRFVRFINAYQGRLDRSDLEAVIREYCHLDDEQVEVCVDYWYSKYENII